MVQPEWDSETDAGFCIIRRNKDSSYNVTLMHGSYLRIKDRVLKLDKEVDLYETSFDDHN